MSTHRIICRSEVYYGDATFCVSTIERDYATHEGTHRGTETIAWKAGLKGNALHVSTGGINTHAKLCIALATTGSAPVEDSA